MAKPVPPFFRVDYEIPDISALQGLARGEATPDQQKRALDWIINEGSRYYDMSFQPGMPDGTAFMDGRRFVGAKIVELLKVSVRDLLLKEQRKKQQGD